MTNTKQKMVLAALSQFVSERDVASANISFILEHGCSDISEITLKLKNEFEKISKAESAIETIQLYYANNFPLPKIEEQLKKEGEEK